jgi:hypothetical protein
MTTGKTIVGVERDRIMIRSAALRVISAILEQPEYESDDSRTDWLAGPPPSHYRRLEPLGFGIVEEGDDWWIFKPEDCKPDVVWPMDVGVAAENGGPDGVLQISRTRTVTTKECRGDASIFSPFMVRADHAAVVDGKLMSCSTIMAWLGGRWVDAQSHRFVGRHYWRDRPVSLDDCIPCNLATGIALRHRYEWAVSLGLENSPSVRFVTDPTGVKEVFRIRDLPDGRDRREALMTWVTDHWRQDRRDPDVERYVRKHLRGTTAFSWRGMECELLPSQFDLDARERFIADRDAMRRTGSDKRLRATALP